MPPTKKGAKFDLSGLLKLPLGWFNQIHILQYMGTLLWKLYTEREKKVSGSFREINILIEKLTPTTDELALENLRCLSAGGVKNIMKI